MNDGHPDELCDASAQTFQMAQPAYSTPGVPPPSSCSTASASISPSSARSTKSPSITAAIAGGVAGAVVIVAVFALIGFCTVTRRARRTADAHNDSVPTEGIGLNEMGAQGVNHGKEEGGGSLTANIIRDALTILAIIFNRDGREIVIVALGGAVNTLLLRSRESTSDIDFFHNTNYSAWPRDEPDISYIRDKASQVARILQMSEHWLNNHASAILNVSFSTNITFTRSHMMDITEPR
jgi:hypothetical protein